MIKEVTDLLEEFNIDGEIVESHPFTSGHINSTVYICIKNNGTYKEYVLQRINKNVFKKPDEVMANIENVTNFIEYKLKKIGKDSSRNVLKFYTTRDGKSYSIDQNGDFWRIYKYIDHSITFDTTDSLTVLNETGKAFGEFQKHLSDFPSEALYDIIPHFHNTQMRYDAFKSKIKQNPVDRASSVEQEIDLYLQLEDFATQMSKMQQDGQLPLRVTHNDTKSNNVLFDEKSLNHLCVIDLDTVMPGLVGFDFGDAIRFAGNTASEDERDLKKVKIDLEKFKAFTQGFLSEVAPNLTQNEKNTLALGAISMTTECGVRFLTDYLDGDNYFKIAYPEQNLDRARCQLALSLDMIKNYSKMKQIVDECYNEIMGAQENEN